MYVSKLAALSALSVMSYYSRPVISANSLGGGLVISSKFFVCRSGKRFKSLKSRSNRRKSKRCH